ncbi:uncharacterized protein LOC132800145 [Ziziphus jujuba]|uniref:Uncharacterized protein LOC132800145 n=1 Tax=Ziziphus jujuba TaxID=326968 RepID=A0ABM3ZXD8_ZIZJJ|nr:uncharacterized protein LOC132800145 [Ziziphus jujuba]
MKRNLYKPLPDGKHHLQIGKTFECAAEFRKVLIEYSIQEGFNIYRVKNEKNRVTCECAAMGCGWRVHASLMADNITFQIKTLREDHCCTMLSKNPMVTCEWLSRKIEDKDGFLKGYRPFIGVDDCHLKGQFGGVLLIAVGVDANNNIFLLAFFVCEGKNYDNQIWFLNLISEYIGVHETRRICFMSDRQKGLLKAINEVFPNAFNWYCARHIFANLKSHFPGVEVRNLFWAASRSTNIKDFNVAMEGIKAVNLDAYTWLKDIPVDSWSKHVFGIDIKVDHVTNNLTESFNSQVDSIRNKPILQLVESLRRKVMKKFSKREQKAKDWLTDLPPLVQAKVNKFQKEGRHIRVIHAENSEFEVLHESVIVLVDFNKATCDCGVRQIYGIPCKHAMACITHLGVGPIPYVASCLSKEPYMLNYAGKIHPIPNELS